MAFPSSNSALLNTDDQTDEDFFDKLVDDDDFGVRTSEAGGMSRVLSDGTSGESDDDGNAGTSKARDLGVEASRKDLGSEVEVSSDLVPEIFALEKVMLLGDQKVEKEAPKLGSTDLSTEKAGVKDWSAFSGVGGQHDFGGFGWDSDFLPEDSTGFSENAMTNQNSNGEIEDGTVSGLSTCSNKVEPQGGQVCHEVSEQSSSLQQLDAQAVLDVNNPLYWESLYPGWKYDLNTGQWYQVGSYDINSNVQANGHGGAFITNSERSLANTQLDDLGSASDDINVSSRSINQLTEDSAQSASDRSTNVSYHQQTAGSIVESIAEGSITSDSSWNYASQETGKYPANMIFDPQYPGWYYDTNIQQWQTLETYSQTVEMSTSNQATSVDSGTTDVYSLEHTHTIYANDAGKFENQALKGQNNQVGEWEGFYNSYSQLSLGQPQPADPQDALAAFSGNQQKLNFYDQANVVGNHTEIEASFKAMGTISSETYGNTAGVNKAQGFIPSNDRHQYNESKVGQFHQVSASHIYSGNQTLMGHPQPAFQSESLSPSQFSYTAMESTSSVGRPAHSLVTFGFGGRLVVMKNTSFGTYSAYGSQDAERGTVFILNLMDVIMENSGNSDVRCYSLDYFHSLCNQSFPGPLVGGGATSKELNKWIDERIKSCEASSTNPTMGEHLRLLLSLLKISYQYYGKLRSPYGTDSSFLESDGPESAVTKLFASSKRNGGYQGEYGKLTPCMHNLPTEDQSRAISVEVQSLLVSGRRKEALQCAQEGMLWGPALVLATQLGEKYYVDTVKQMANRQLVCGSPLRSLCLLIAGQPADVFSEGDLANDFSKKASLPQQSGQVLANGMLDHWEENLALISANRTKDDGLVTVHLGDCLWKERGEVIAAHTCYLLAEANFESYSNSARLCLIGADHLNNPRTFIHPQAIQRTEFYEYSRVHWNPQFQLLPFQPYKLVYAYMLAEVGKISESSRYCQALLKLLKSSGRSPEVEMWRSIASSLDDRLRMYQQGPAKLVDRLIGTLDKSIHRMIGAPPLALPPMSENRVQGNEHDNVLVPQKVVGSQTTMAVTSLVPSASVEAISEWTSENRQNIHNRSVSEPDFARSPKQEHANTSNNASSSDTKSKTMNSGGSSRFSGFLQKTIGWVSRSHSGRQAKLGEANKFYYDEKLKRWVEEGAELPSQEVSPPPPPTTASFQSKVSDCNINGALKSQNSSIGVTEAVPSTEMHNSGIPPVPPSQNQFSRGRMGIRSRYVDTFNKSKGMIASSFQPPSSQPAKPMDGAKLFVPAPVVASATDGDASERILESSSNEDTSSNAKAVDSSFTSLSSQPLSNSMQRFPSMDSITPLRNKSAGMKVQNGDGSIVTPSRAASWSGVFSDPSNPKTVGSGNPVVKLGSLPHVAPAVGNPKPSVDNLGDELHEVEL